MSTMRQAVCVRPGQMEIRRVQRPSAGPRQVLLRVRRIGVCGSDIHVWHGKHPYTSYPVVQGHEFAAEVETLGVGVHGPVVGDKVTAMPQITCGQCGPCRRGQENICDQLKVQGFQAPGAAQEYFMASADQLVPLPGDFTWEQGAMVEPVAVAVHAVSKAGELARQRVAVLGAGPIGNLVAQVARASGATVMITDISDKRLVVAGKCGIENISDAGTEKLTDAAARLLGQAPDVILECVGVEKTMDQAVPAVRKGGVIVIVGVFGEMPRINLGLVQDRELTIRGTLMYQRRDYVRAIELMSSGKVATCPLESRHFDLEQYASAYEFIDAQRDKAMKVFIDI